VEVRWRSLFRSTSLGKRCTSYNSPLLENVLQTVCRKIQEESGTGGFDLEAPFSRLEKPRNRMGRDLDCMVDVLMGFHRSRWAHPLPIFNRTTLTLRQGCSAILKRVGNAVRSTSLAKGGTSKKRPSPHLHKVPTRSNKVSPRTLRTVLVNGEAFKLCSLLQPSATSSLLGPNILLSTLLSDTLIYVLSLVWKTKFHIHTKQQIKLQVSVFWSLRISVFLS
jgi:hypothetical protein